MMLSKSNICKYMSLCMPTCGLWVSPACLSVLESYFPPPHVLRRLGVLCHVGQCHHRNSHLSCLKCHVSSVCLQFLRKYVKCLQSFVVCGSVSSLSLLTYFSLRMSLHYYSVFCHSVLVKVLVIFVILMNKLHWLSYHCQVQVLIVMFVSYSVTMLSSHDV